jgi:hypothetical protein
LEASPLPQCPKDGVVNLGSLGTNGVKLGFRTKERTGSANKKLILFDTLIFEIYKIEKLNLEIK